MNHSALVRCLTSMAVALALAPACGTSSADVDASPGTVDASPGDPDALVTGYKLTLTWTDNADNEAGFAVERAFESAGAFAEITRVGVDVETYEDLGVEIDVGYCYRVRAFNSAGESAYSNEACGVPTADGMARVRVR